MPRGVLASLALLVSVLIGAAIIFSPPGGDLWQDGGGLGSKVAFRSLDRTHLFWLPISLLSSLLEQALLGKLTHAARQKVVLDDDGEPQSVRDLAAEAKKVPSPQPPSFTSDFSTPDPQQTHNPDDSIA